MDVKYGSLEDAVKALLNKVDQLDDPIQAYIQQSSTIGEDGNVWNGTAAAQAKPLLDKLQADIQNLQIMCNQFADKINVSRENYETADANAVNNMYDKIVI